MQNRARTRFRHKQIHPFSVMPQIEPEKSQGHQEQAESRYLAGGACPDCVHQTVLLRS